MQTTCTFCTVLGLPWYVGVSVATDVHLYPQPRSRIAVAWPSWLLCCCVSCTVGTPVVAGVEISTHVLVYAYVVAGCMVSRYPLVQQIMLAVVCNYQYHLCSFIVSWSGKVACFYGML